MCLGFFFGPMNKKNQFLHQLARFYLLITLIFGVAVLVVGTLEEAGAPNASLVYGFIAFTIVLYAVIGLMSRTTDIDAYYVANREVPALFNGMATAADWMSAASFLGLSGTIYLMGFDGLAYILGWTGGFVLVGLLVAPYLRKLGQLTVAEYIGQRFGGPQGKHSPRLIAVLATVICSFVYLVAQIYGVGLITSRFTGVEFGIGVFFGLAGVLLCSFLGGMRAVTWTQVAQCIIMLVAFILPISLLSSNLTGNPVHIFTYHQLLEKIDVLEVKIASDPAELEVRAMHRERAMQLRGLIEALPDSWSDGLEQRKLELELVRRSGGSFADIKRAEKKLRSFPQTADAARLAWGAEMLQFETKMNPQASHIHAYDSPTTEQANQKRINFLALVFSLMAGTAALPHLLSRFLTTTSVAGARNSVVWALFFIALVYTSAPALATFVKYMIFNDLVGSSFANLPEWVGSWKKVDKTLFDLSDINHDGIVQLAEISIGADVITLAAPEIAGLPYFVSGLVATGGLAAALSTADGLLLTIANSISHDIYYRMLDVQATTQKRVTISKIILLILAMGAAWLAATKPGNILFLVGAAFSIAASSLFPVLIAATFWRRANWQGAVAGMLVGLLVSIVYMLGCWAPLMLSLNLSPWRWFGIEPVSAAVFGVPAGTLALILVSFWTPPSKSEELAVLRAARAP